MTAKTSTRKKRRRPRHTEEFNEAFRRHIINVARELFIKDGYEGVSMRKIATKVPCAASTLYLYFPDKTSIILNIWEELFDISFEQCYEAANKHRKPIKKIRVFCIEYVHYWVVNPEYFHMIWLLDERDKAGVKYKQTSRALSKYDWIIGVIDNSKEKGEISLNLSSAKLGDLLFSICHGLSTHIVAHSHMTWREAKSFVEISMDILLAGMIQKT